MIVLATIWHSGTRHYYAGLKRVHGRDAVNHHLNSHVLDIARQADEVYTTYRDPLRIAATWINLDKGAHINDWKQQWSSYRILINELKPKVFDTRLGREQHGCRFNKYPIGASDDKYGIHDALDNKDYDRYYQLVPVDFLVYAKNVLEDCPTLGADIPFIP